MITRTYVYPGDPPEPVQLLFGEEFTRRHPSRTITITTDRPDDVPVVIPVEDVCCDTCNAGIGPTDPCALTPDRLYCWTCYQEWIAPHLHEQEVVK